MYAIVPAIDGVPQISNRHLYEAKSISNTQAVAYFEGTIEESWTEITEEEFNVANPVMPTQDATVSQSTLTIKNKTGALASPNIVTVTDATTCWNVIICRKIVEDTTTSTYNYEYIETTMPKDSNTQDEMVTIITALVDKMFRIAENPAGSLYDEFTSSVTNLKINLALASQIIALTARIVALEGSGS